MIRAISHAPKDYKFPSFNKAQTTLSEEFKGDVDKDLAELKGTW